MENIAEPSVEVSNPATQYSEAGRSKSEASLDNLRRLSKIKRGRGCSSVVEHVPSTPVALIPPPV